MRSESTKWLRSGSFGEIQRIVMRKPEREKRTFLGTPGFVLSFEFGVSVTRVGAE